MGVGIMGPSPTQKVSFAYQAGIPIMAAFRTRRGPLLDALFRVVLKENQRKNSHLWGPKTSNHTMWLQSKGPPLGLKKKPLSVAVLQKQA